MILVMIDTVSVVALRIVSAVSVMMLRKNIVGNNTKDQDRVDSVGSDTCGGLVDDKDRSDVGSVIDLAKDDNESVTAVDGDSVHDDDN